VTEAPSQLTYLADTTLVLDACCLIDLYASGCMTDILSALPCPVAVARYVLDAEALSMPNLTSSSSNLPFDVVDLASEDEEMAFIDFAVAFGADGEAYTCAIAVQRNWAVASNERKVIRILQAAFPSIAIVTTPEIVGHWAETAHPSTEELRQVIRRIELDAHYRPGRAHPVFDWWNTHFE